MPEPLQAFEPGTTSARLAAELRVLVRATVASDEAAARRLAVYFGLSPTSLDKMLAAPRWDLGLAVRAADAARISPTVTGV